MTTRLSQLPWTRLLAVGWAAASGTYLVWLVVSVVLTLRVVARTRPLDDPGIHAALRKAADRLGVRHTLRLCTSDRVRSPVICCWGRRPVLLLPEEWSAADATIDWVAVFCHELAHLKRRDHLSSLLAELLVCAYPWQPLAWWTRRQLGRFEELACDDWVLTHSTSRTAYAESLLGLVPQRRPALALPTVSSRKGLVARVRRILSDHNINPRLGVKWACAAVLAAACTAGAIAFAQTRPVPRTLKITVVHSETQKPLDGVVLSLWIDNVNSFADADEKGRCTIDLPQGKVRRFSVTAQKEGFALKTIAWEDNDGNPAIPAEYTIPIEPGTTIGGIIQDEQGKPIPGVSLTVRIMARSKGPNGERISGGHPVTLSPTDSQGRWQYDAAPSHLESDDVFLHYSHPDYIGRGVFQPVGPVEDLRKQVAIMMLNRGVMVKGRIVDTAGNPIVGAQVNLGKYGRYSGHQDVRSGDDGRFELPPSIPGKNTLSVQADGFSPAACEVLVAENMDPVTFRLDPGGEIKARVVDSDGRPVVGAYVRVRKWKQYECLWWNVKTDDEGRFCWRAAPKDEEVVFEVRKDDLMTQIIALKAAESEQTVTMGPLLTVRGSVTDTETGQPIDAFTLILGHDRGNQRDWDREMGLNLTDGKYEIRIDLITFASNPKYGWAEPRQEHYILIEAPGYTPIVSRKVANTEGEATVDFRLSKGNQISGTVLAPDGRPAAGASVVFTPEDLDRSIWIQNGDLPHAHGYQHAVTDTVGRFAFSSYEGDYRLVVVSDAGFAEVKREAFLASPRITVTPWGRIEGTLRMGNRPGAGETVSLNLEELPYSVVPQVRYQYETRTDSQGRFVMERVAPGTTGVIGRQITIQERPGGTFRVGNSHSVPVEIKAGETVRVALGGTGRPVVGRVTVPEEIKSKIDWREGYSHIVLHVEGMPDFYNMDAAAWDAWSKIPPDRQMTLRRQQRTYLVHLNNDGTFRVEDIPAGDYWLRIGIMDNSGDWQTDGRLLGRIARRFTVPEMPGGRSDEPLDLGDMPMTPLGDQP
ncbi:MAG: carboxypeptidase regulatory-like domain-containing protein [Planctomycetes bacterium]|nr:carboxypeptidase regulatory-like domain-containing protein [Planctomycetota bacterium]